jgi:hypothetical protein
MVDLPIACELSTPELARRRRTVLAQLMSLVEERRVTNRGLHLRFAPTKGVVAALGSFVEDERLCCRFLDFRLDVPRGGGSVWLRLSGPRGTRRFVTGLLPDSDVSQGAV